MVIISKVIVLFLYLQVFRGGLRIFVFGILIIIVLIFLHNYKKIKIMTNSNHRFNWRKEPKDKRDVKSLRHLGVKDLLPRVYNLPIEIPIYDQHNIGSCTANSASVCYDFEFADMKSGHEFHPSRLFLYYNTRMIEGTTSEDNGAFIRNTFKSMNKYGMCPEHLWPYKEKKFAVHPTPEAYTEAQNNTIIKYSRVPQTISAIKKTLVSGAAIAFGFNVYESFEHNDWSKNKIMPIPKPKFEKSFGGHAVAIVGYDDDIACCKIQNSWSSSWGDKGYFWMPYELITSKECSDFWCIESIKNSNAPMNYEPNKITEFFSILWNKIKLFFDL